MASMTGSVREMLSPANGKITIVLRPITIGVEGAVKYYVENPDDVASKLYIGNDEINWSAVSGQDDQIRETVEEGRPVLGSAVANTEGVKEETKKVIKEATQKAVAAEQSGQAMVRNAQKVIGAEIDKIR